MFCPFVPNITFRGNSARAGKVRLYLTNFVMNLAVNIILVTFPLMWYGIHFFDVTLPILDELCRYFVFIRSNDFPGTFPEVLPVIILNSHIAFPVLSLTNYFLGLLLFLFYRSRFHPQKAVPANVIQALSPGFDLGQNMLINGQFFPSGEDWF